MIVLNKNSLEKLLNANIQMFSGFPSVMDYLKEQHGPQGPEKFRDLVREIKASKEFHDLIVKCVSSDFTIEDEGLEIATPFQLSNLIRSKSVQISDGEETWISTIEKLEQSMKSSCCSTRAAIAEEAYACYEDLIRQCDETWIFVKNIKAATNVSKIVFLMKDKTQKQV